MRQQLKKLNLFNHVKLLGRQKNISKIMNTMDLYVQSSKYGEGFPNVVAEAMAHEIPCVVTDVGDAKFIIGQTGWIVPANNSLKLATSIRNDVFENYIVKNGRIDANNQDQELRKILI